MNKIPYIPLEQFISMVNLRNFSSCDKIKGMENYKRIRFYYNDSVNINEHIDLSWNIDCFENEELWKVLKKTLSENILNRVVTNFYYNPHDYILEIYLCNKKDLE